MDGKIFLYTQATPPPISYSPNFSFDLQRFAEITVNTLEQLQAAIGDSSTLSAGDTIKLDGAINAGNTTLTIAKSGLTLDLNGKTLTTAAQIGVQVKNGVAFTLKDSTATTENDGIGEGEIKSTFVSNADAKSGLRDKDDAAVVMVGENVGSTNNATFTMTSGKISSELTSVNATDGSGKLIGVDVIGESTFDMSGGSVKSSESLAVYFGTNGGSSNIKTSDNKSSNGYGGGGTFTMTGGKLESNTSEDLSTIQVSGNHVKSTTIDISGGEVIYNRTNTKDDSESRGAIFSSGASNITISGNAKITSTHVGIEMRAGTLNVKGGEITSNSANGIEYNSNANAAFRQGVAIAVAQSSTAKNITVNIEGGTVKGYSALTVANPKSKGVFGSTATGVDSTGNHYGEPKTGTTGYRETGDDKYQIGTVSVNVTGGTIESTAPKTADSSEHSSSSNTYTIKGQNAIANLDKRVTINMTGNATVKGALATDSSRTDGTGYNVTGTGNNFSNFTYTTGKSLVSYYKAATEGSDAVEVAIVGVANGWNTHDNEKKKWDYVVEGAGSDANNIVVSLAPDTNNILKLASGDLTVNTDTTIDLDLTNSQFASLNSADYTKLDASGITNNKLNFNIKGNANLTAITGGAGNDTLTAVNTTGVSLNGGTGADSLVGGAGDDTFIHTASSHDIIDNYDIANDTVIVSVEPTTKLTAPSGDTKDGISYESTNSKFVVSFGANDSLTFNSAEQIKLTYQDDVYYYKADRVIKKDKEATLGSAFKEKTFNVNKLSSEYVTYSSVATIDAQAVQTAVNITGNSESANSIIGAKGGGNIVGGDNDDFLQASGGSTTLNGGEGSDTLIGTTETGDKNIYEEFVFTGGNDVIKNYNEGSGDAKSDLVVVRNLKMADASYSVETIPATQEDSQEEESGQDAQAGQTAQDTINIVLDFGGDTLTIENVEDKNVSVRGGYTYNKNYFAHNKGITLAAGYSSLVSEAGSEINTYNGSSTEYVTINAAAVNTAISVIGNSLNNYIVGSTATPTSAIIVTLNGGEGNDRFDVSERYVASATEEPKSTKYVFEHDSGKDEVFGFNQDNDILGIAVESITAAKAGNSKLTFTIDKDNSVVLRGDDDITQVSIQGSDKADYLTKDGYVKTTTLKLFSSAKGRIELGDDPYKGTAISEVVANSVKSQSVTLVATQGGTFTYAKDNKKRDGFVYGDGNVKIVNYEAGKDRIDLNGASLTSFTVTKDENQKPQDVVLTVGDGTNSGNISLTGAAGQEVLLRDGSSRSFKKMVFAESGILQNKAKNPTMVTVSGAATEYSATGTNASVKKIYVEGVNNSINIQAGNKNNTIIDASKAGKGVTLSGDKKNDKLIGSNQADTFVYTAGKDIIQNFSDTENAKDQISLSSDQFGKLGEAKITAGSKSIKFKFANKDTLTVKATNGSTLSGSLDITSEGKTDDITRTYTKNAIADGGKVSLTSAFSGTFKTDDKKLETEATNVDGTRVSKNLTFKGTEANETFSGGKKKNTFKGGGGADTFIGGSGKDIFFYAKGEKGETTIADFEFGANKDRLKIASGTIGEITTVTSDNKTAIQFAMNSGKKGDTSNIGWFKITSGATYNSDGTKKDDTSNIDPTKVAIKANNTYYWFAEKEITDTESGDVLAQKGQLITSDTRVSAGDVSGFSSIIDLNYSTNLAKSGVAVKVAGVKPTKAS